MGVATKTFGKTGKITVHFLTQVGTVSRGTKSPDPAQDAQAADVAALYADFVSKATKSLDIAIYDFRLTGKASTTFIDALNAVAQSDGKKVRIGYNHNPHKDRTPEVFAYLGADPAPDSAGVPSALHKSIETRGIEDTAELEPPTQAEPIDPQSHLMHSKYIIRDAGTEQAAVLMGSTNFTNDAWSLQDNNIVVFEAAPQLADYYANDFEEMWQAGQIANSGQKDTGTMTIDGVEVGVAFSPGQGRQIDAEIASTISTAEQRLFVASMVISSGTVLGALADRSHRVAEFGGIFDATEMDMVMKDWAKSSRGALPSHSAETLHLSRGTVANQATKAAHEPAAAGTRQHSDRTHNATSRSLTRAGASQGKAELFANIAPLLHSKSSLPYSADTPHNFMHDKIAVADDTVITGSFNFSTNATRNAENVVIIKDAKVADAFVDYINQLMQLYPHMGLPEMDQAAD